MRAMTQVEGTGRQKLVVAGIGTWQMFCHQLWLQLQVRASAVCILLSWLAIHSAAHSSDRH